VSGRVRTMSTAKALLARGWIVRLPEFLSPQAQAVAGEQWTALEWTHEGEKARTSIKPLPATPECVVALLRSR